MPILDDYVNIAEAAEILAVHPGTVQRLCRDSKLVGEKADNGWLIHNDVLRAFARTCKGHRGRPSNRDNGDEERLQEQLSGA